ncbi:MAG: hypothetical protein ACI4QT_07625 [Kiritimatiellia bacterium]
MNIRILFLFLVSAAMVYGAIYQHGSNSGKGGVISSGQRTQPAARPAANPVQQPRPAAHPYLGGSGYPTPYISDIDVEDGKIKGYHVVSPAVYENPFGGLQGTVNSIRTPEQAAQAGEPEQIIVRRYKLAPPSTEAAKSKEEAERVLMQETVSLAQVSVSFTEEQLKKHAMALLKEAYRQNGAQLLQAYTYAIASTGIAKTPVNSAFPVASEELLMEAFRSGVALQVVRPRPVRVSCGLCDGSGKIAVERVVTDGKERIVTGTCPRCDGTGKRAAEIEALYTIRIGGKKPKE